MRVVLTPMKNSPSKAGSRFSRAALQVSKSNIAYSSKWAANRKAQKHVRVRFRPASGQVAAITVDEGLKQKADVMMPETAKFKAFSSLHRKGNPLLLLNIWDAGSAKIVADAGAGAIATGSWAVAAAHGYADGETLPLEYALHTAKRIVEAVDLPVSMDIESGYGRTPAQLAETVKRVLDTGVVGLNIEDQMIGHNALYSVPDQAARIEACRTTADTAGVPLFINARSDLYFQAQEDADEAQLEAEVLARATAYHQAGADGLFTPGLWREDAIKTLCAASPMPVNIMVMQGCPTIETLTRIGVSRISYGPGPYVSAMESLSARAAATYGAAA